MAMVFFLLLNVVFPAVCGWVGVKARWSLWKMWAVMLSIWIPLQLLAHFVFGYQGVFS